MNQTKNKRWLKWLLIVLGAAVVVVVAIFIVQAIMGGAKYGTKEYSTEASAEGLTIKVTSVERVAMLDEKCQERIVLLGNKEDYDCLIINVTITNNTDGTFDYSYRNFGYRDPRSDKLLSTSLTNINFEGVDVTKELAAGESHSQEVLLSIRNTVNIGDLELVYRIKPGTDNETTITLPL